MISLSLYSLPRNGKSHEILTRTTLNNEKNIQLTINFQARQNSQRKALQLQGSSREELEKRKGKLNAAWRRRREIEDYRVNL